MSSVIFANKQNFGSLFRKKQSFLIQVYLLLIFQILITAFVAKFLRQRPAINAAAHKLWAAWFILSIICIFALAMLRGPMIVKILILSAFSFLIGLQCIAASTHVSPQTIEVALVSAIAIFAVFTMIGVAIVAAGIDLSFMAFGLFALLIGLLIAFVVMMAIPVSKTVHRVVLYFAISLFSVYIAFDTNIMLQKDFTNPIQGSINLYLDLLNIFTDIIVLQE